ncbi:MAG TPA: tetratricopeptide repeat protein, partial [Spirochaetales bacterium]|nr:tetratricopeptide repeat protein [Spirochaetales bacterium]
MSYTRVATFAAIVALGVTSAFSQSGLAPAMTPADELRQGIELFANARYAEALPVFDSLFLDPASGSLRADGAYWSAMTLLASGDPAAAERAIETFLATFPGHEKTSEMVYQKARAAFLRKDYERA